MKLGIDLDETIVGIMDPLLIYYKERTGRSIPKEEIYTSHLREIWNCSKEEENNIIRDFYASDHFDNLKLYNGVLESLSKLKENNELYIITSRWGIGKDKTHKFLDDNLNGLVSKTFFTSEHSKEGLKKEEICIKYSISLHIEDDPNIALKCAESNVKVLLFNRPWNKNLFHKKVTRISSWPEALEILGLK